VKRDIYQSLKVETGDEDMLWQVVGWVTGGWPGGDGAPFDPEAICPSPSAFDLFTDKIVRVEEFVEWIDFKGSLRSPLPMTKEVAEHFASSYGAKNLTEWRLSNWGSSEIWSVGEWKGDEIRFHSAFHPPRKLYELLAQDFPSLEFRVQWIENGVNDSLAGIILYQKGIMESEMVFGKQSREGRRVQEHLITDCWLESEPSDEEVKF
jgi:hypothetical protein